MNYYVRNASVDSYSHFEDRRQREYPRYRQSISVQIGIVCEHYFKLIKGILERRLL